MKAVAIDGPAGAGKSTISRKVAEGLGFIYVDTGALYRAIGYYVLSKGADVSDETAVMGLLAGVEISLKFVDTEQRVFLGGRDITGKIRTEAVSMAASAVSALPAVRAYLLELQRSLARENNVVMDGRDIGTVVLPDAPLKIFLTASPEERARRRVRQMEEGGQAADFETILQEIRQRDFQDSTRETAPLKPAADSVLLDTSGISFQESVEKLVSLVRERMGREQAI